MKPILAVETPSFMGMGNENDKPRFASLMGERSTEIRFSSLYIHGSLESRMGFDISTLLSGDIKDIDTQEVTMLDANLVENEAVLVSLKYKGSRYGLIVDGAEEAETLTYLQFKAKDAEKHNCNRIYL